MNPLNFLATCQFPCRHLLPSSQAKESLANETIPYSGKFSRCPIFAVFADDCLTAKIKPVKKRLKCAAHNGQEYAHL